MIRRLLRPVLPVVVSVALTGGAFFALGAWRRADDTRWCKDATADATVSAEILKEQRAACATQRRRQRTMFGAVWRTGGQATAACGVELARLQLLDVGDTSGAAAILGKYGIDPAGFDAPDQARFITACLAHDRQASR
jgi:hypothetical protein